MKPGQSITYSNGGVCRLATVAAVVGAGPSGKKRLDIQVNPALVALDVPHEDDVTAGEDFWALLDTSRHATDPGPIVGGPFVGVVERMLVDDEQQDGPEVE